MDLDHLITFVLNKYVMKNVLVLLLVVASIPFVAQAQVPTCGNFKLVEQEIIYQQVFQDTVSIAQLEKYYKSLPNVANLVTSAEGIQFDFNDLTVDYKKFQFSQNATPLIIQSGKFSGKAAVGVKDGRYRVTVKGLQLTGNIGYKMITKKENLTPYASKNSATDWAQDFCLPSTLGLLDKAFTDKLQFKKAKDDW